MSDKIGLFTGSFDPITNGHLDMIRRASQLFDKLYVGLFYNEAKPGFWPIDKRQRVVAAACREFENVEVVTSSNELAVDVAERLGVTHLVRGVRNATDLEYEINMEFFNRQLNEKVETIYLTAPAHLREVSSSRVRELIHFGADIAPFVPKEVLEEV